MIFFEYSISGFDPELGRSLILEVSSYFWLMNILYQKKNFRWGIRNEHLNRISSVRVTDSAPCKLLSLCYYLMPHFLKVPIDVQDVPILGKFD